MENKKGNKKSKSETKENNKDKSKKDKSKQDKIKKSKNGKTKSSASNLEGDTSKSELDNESPKSKNNKAKLDTSPINTDTSKSEVDIKQSKSKNDKSKDKEKAKSKSDNGNKKSKTKTKEASKVKFESTEIDTDYNKEKSSSNKKENSKKDGEKVNKDDTDKKNDHKKTKENNKKGEKKSNNNKTPKKKNLDDEDLSPISDTSVNNSDSSNLGEKNQKTRKKPVNRDNNQGTLKNTDNYFVCNDDVRKHKTIRKYSDVRISISKYKENIYKDMRSILDPFSDFDNFNSKKCSALGKSIRTEKSYKIVKEQKQQEDEFAVRKMYAEVFKPDEPVSMLRKANCNDRLAKQKANRASCESDALNCTDKYVKVKSFDSFLSGENNVREADVEKKCKNSGFDKRKTACTSRFVPKETSKLLQSCTAPNENEFDQMLGKMEDIVNQLNYRVGSYESKAKAKGKILEAMKDVIRKANQVKEMQRRCEESSESSVSQEECSKCKKGSSGKMGHLNNLLEEAMQDSEENMIDERWRKVMKILRRNIETQYEKRKNRQECEEENEPNFKELYQLVMKHIQTCAKPKERSCPKEEEPDEDEERWRKVMKNLRKSRRNIEKQYEKRKNRPECEEESNLDIKELYQLAMKQKRENIKSYESEEVVTKKSATSIGALSINSETIKKKVHWKEEEPDYKALYESLKKQIDNQNGACTSREESSSSSCTDLVSEPLSETNSQSCSALSSECTTSECTVSEKSSTSQRNNVLFCNRNDKNNPNVEKTDCNLKISNNSFWSGNRVSCDQSENCKTQQMNSKNCKVKIVNTVTFQVNKETTEKLNEQKTCNQKVSKQTPRKNILTCKPISKETPSKKISSSQPKCKQTSYNILTPSQQTSKESPSKKVSSNVRVLIENCCVAPVKSCKSREIVTCVKSIHTVCSEEKASCCVAPVKSCKSREIVTCVKSIHTVCSEEKASCCVAPVKSCKSRETVVKCSRVCVDSISSDIVFNAAELLKRTCAINKVQFCDQKGNYQSSVKKSNCEINIACKPCKSKEVSACVQNDKIQTCVDKKNCSIITTCKTKDVSACDQSNVCETRQNFEKCSEKDNISTSIETTVRRKLNNIKKNKILQAWKQNYERRPCSESMLSDLLTCRQICSIICKPCELRTSRTALVRRKQKPCTENKLSPFNVIYTNVKGCASRAKSCKSRGMVVKKSKAGCHQNFCDIIPGEDNYSQTRCDMTCDDANEGYYDVLGKVSGFIDMWSVWCDRLNDFVGLKRSCEEQFERSCEEQFEVFTNRQSYSELSVFRIHKSHRPNLLRKSSESVDDFLRSVEKDFEMKQDRLVEMLVKVNRIKKGLLK